MTVPEERREETIQAVASHITDTGRDIHAFKALQNCGITEKEIPLLLQWVDYRSIRVHVHRELAKLPNEEVLDYIENRIANANSITDPVFALAKDIGAPAEQVLWPALGSEDVGIQGRTLQILGQIGTDASVQYLETGDHGLPARRTAPTISQIQRRVQ